MSFGRRRERHQVALGVADEADALAPRHVGGLAHDRRAGGAQLGDGGVYVVDVDEELVARAGPGLDSREHPRRVLRRDRELRVPAAEADVAGGAVRPRHPEVRVEAEPDVERGDRLDVLGVDDRKGSQGHGGQSSSIRIARATRPPSVRSQSPMRTVTGPSNGWRPMIERGAPSSIPWSWIQRSIAGSESETRTKRPHWPTSSESRLW